ncbi:MAG TPA: type II secretion system inner membrane protein GspF [Kofleriaceae bacterium]|nr:type II secretion system inner membrane protein GspF [Kofleriaceae bacterium]
MPLYAYKGVGPTGKSAGGVREAESPKALRQMLRKDGIVVTQVDLSKGGKKVQSKKGLSKDVDVGEMFSKVKRGDIAAFTRQLATLLKAGITLGEALAALFEQSEKPKLKRVIGEVRGAVNEGSSLGDAMARHPSIYDELYISMVRAGEAAGNLDDVLLRLADFTESSQKLRGKVMSALMYPAIMMGVGALIMSILMILVVPEITKMFTQQGKTLPLNTRFLIWTSHIFGAYWFIWLVVMIFGVIGFRSWIRSESGKEKWHRFVLRTPVFGSLLRQVAVSRFARTLGTMLQAGVPMLRSIEIAKEVLGNVVLMKAVEGARAGVTEGESLATMLKKTGHFPATVTQMIAVGERSGTLEQMLLRIADAYEAEIEMKLQRMTSLLEPMMILIMGFSVAFVVMSILQPLIDMTRLR